MLTALEVVGGWEGLAHLLSLLQEAAKVPEGNHISFLTKFGQGPQKLVHFYAGVFLEGRNTKCSNSSVFLLKFKTGAL